MPLKIFTALVQYAACFIPLMTAFPDKYSYDNSRCVSGHYVRRVLFDRKRGCYIYRTLPYSYHKIAKLQICTLVFFIIHRYVVLVPFPGYTGSFIPLFSYPSRVSQRATFLACLCDVRDPKEHLLVLCCFPCHLKSEVKTDVAKAYNVILQGDSTSNKSLNIDDQACFELPKTYTLLQKEDAFLEYVLMHLPILIDK